MTQKSQVPVLIKQTKTHDCSNKKLFLILSVTNVSFVFLTILAVGLVIYFNLHHHREQQVDEYYMNNLNECGMVFEPNNLLRIIGGVKANDDSWPWHAMLITNYHVSHLQIGAEYLVHNQTYGYKCGATLISRKTLLTAAHCVYNKFYIDVNNQTYAFSLKNHEILQGVSIYMGDSDLKNNRNKYSDYFEARVSRILVHENYDEENGLNDIALLYLDQPIELSKNVQIACLPTTMSFNYPIIDSVLYAVGWGVLKENASDTSMNLQNVKLQVYNPYLCNYLSQTYKLDWNAQLCAGIYEGGKDTCNGDSGSSVYVLDKIDDKLRYVAVGIVSYGEGCARPTKLGIYTRISYFIDWIKINME